MSLSKMGDAISTLRKHGHSMSSDCDSCDGTCKYSSGGEIKGVHTSSSDLDKPSAHAKFPKAEKTMAGESKAGYGAKEASDPLSPVGKSARRTFRESAKDEHHRVLGEMKSMPNPKLKGLAHGGEVTGKSARNRPETSSSNRQHQKGVHQSITGSDPGTSVAGSYHGKYGSNQETSKRIHAEKLEESRSMPDPKLKGLAEGGEVDSDNDGDEILHSVMGEFHESLKSGDHKGAVESLRALIHSIKGEE